MVDLYDTIVHEGIHINKGAIYSLFFHTSVYSEASKRTAAERVPMRQGRKHVNARKSNLLLVALVASVILATHVWTSEAMAVKLHAATVADASRCFPSSTDPSVLAASQLACHQGKFGDGVQISIRKVSGRRFWLSDSAQEERTSIFLLGPALRAGGGSVVFQAFYSLGAEGLLGKTGCVGTLQSGSVLIEKSKRGGDTVRYDLVFQLKSPVGWPKDCDHVARLSGEVRI